MEEISEYFELLVISSGILLILGDFNIHVDNSQDKEGVEFSSLVESLGMTQHVTEPTHRSGHTLDLVLTRNQDNIMPHVAVKDDCFPDHYPVFCELPLQCLKAKTQVITYRKTKAIQPDSFISDILASSLPTIPSYTPSDSAISLYNSVLSSIMDSHAPEKIVVYQYVHNPTGTPLRYEKPSSRENSVNACGARPNLMCTETCILRRSGRLTS